MRFEYAKSVIYGDRQEVHLSSRVNSSCASRPCDSSPHDLRNSGRDFNVNVNDDIAVCFANNSDEIASSRIAASLSGRSSSGDTERCITREIPARSLARIAKGGNRDWITRAREHLGGRSCDMRRTQLRNLRKLRREPASRLAQGTRWIRAILGGNWLVRRLVWKMKYLWDLKAAPAKH